MAERRRVLGNESLAAVAGAETSVLRAARLAIDTASPVSAEGVVEDELVVLEPLLDVASTSEVGIWDTEFSSVGLVQGYASRDLAAREEPHLDGFGSPFHGVDAASISIETRPKGIWSNSIHIAT